MTDYLRSDIREHLADVAGSLRGSARNLTAEAAELRDRADALDVLRRSLPVPCAWCQKPMPAGRSDKECCSPSCTARRYRANRGKRAEAAVAVLLGT